MRSILFLLIRLICFKHQVIVMAPPNQERWWWWFDIAGTLGTHCQLISTYMAYNDLVRRKLDCVSKKIKNEKPNWPWTDRGQTVERTYWDVERTYQDVERTYRDVDRGGQKYHHFCFMWLNRPISLPNHPNFVMKYIWPNIVGCRNYAYQHSWYICIVS